MRRSRRVAVLLFLAGLLQVFTSPIVAAFPNGVAEYEGYFTGTAGVTVGAHWNVIRSCDGIADVLNASHADKAVFISTIKSYLTIGRDASCGTAQAAGTITRNRIGAAFIIQSMRDGGANSRTNPPSAADIADWEDRINSGSITISWEPNYAFAYNSGYMLPTDGITDDNFYNRPGVADSILFRNASGTVMTAIKADCANINGGIGLPSAWTVNGAMYVDTGGGWTTTSQSVVPGQTIQFIGQIASAAATTSDIWHVAYATNAAGGGAVVLGSGNNGRLAAGATYNVYSQSFTVPAAAADGAQYCRRLGWNPVNSTGGVNGLSNIVCVTVSYSYNLTPTVNSSTSTVKTGDSITFNYAVRNEPGGSATFATSYLYRSIVVPPAAVLPASFFSQKDSIAGCGVYTAAAPGITCVDSLPINNVIFPAGVSNTPAGSRVVVASYPSGTRICQALSITPRNASRDAAQNRDSTLSCVLVAASPYLAAVGGTVWSGGSVVAPYDGAVGGGTIRGVAPTTFGSFGDYGVFATGVVSNFGSASLLTGSALTFANTPSLGSFTSTHKIENMVDHYVTAPHNAGVINAGRIVASGVYKSPADLTLQATVIAPGVNAVIYAPGRTVTIAGNISFGTGGVTRFAQLPSLTIIAGNIQINGVVQRVDANLYGSQTIVTCSEGPRRPVDPTTGITTTGACSRQLTINGSVTVADQAMNSLVLNRSYGGAAVGQASEIIRLRPEAFLTAHELNVTSSSTVMNVVKETELPARY